jgi:hypothetical protein
MIAQRIIYYHADWWRRNRERLAMWVAWRMPRWLAMWCYIRVCAHATTGEWGGTIPNHLDVMTCLKRWDGVDR